ncbi:MULTISPECIES: DNA mismatch repair protein MutS [unclassified Thermosipho (in: thermotogales)]|uniref:lysine 5,6-aminomutase reactivase ATPase KamC n=1 Tax=unclassified Thermosipho (in: thermotogales) TaxID=2676525 RepID=UPI000985A902|nr:MULTISPECIES: DNA mismatch repair protein MutS [unclassified Thermosipho (in: thermotogales)]MBT1248519.1 DNA mismatch repair protein MutS [Thermosipho sp. 1244]OOC47391.1 DNA mismatch repair protein MutS [Thermosipho sp. 1223]
MDIGFDYIKQNLDFSSQIGKRYLENLNLLSDKDTIQFHLKAMEKLFDIPIDKIKNILSHFQDILKTINKLTTGTTLDEIELFQLKQFSYFSNELFEILKDLNLLDCFKLEKLHKPFQILDPENQNLPTFYIYSSYDKELENIRKEKAKIKDEERLLKLSIKEKEIEEKICKNLSEKLSRHSHNFLKNYEIIGFLDLSISKMELSTKLDLKKPNISEQLTIKLSKLFNPEVKEILENTGKHFQKVDITLKNGTQIITGANMGGKTILLKTIALSQILFQKGFYIPAENAFLPIFDDIFFISGDFQDEKLGLSSFAAEMKILNNIFKQIQSNKKFLILLDEPARTTNPLEGRAIVKAIAKLFNKPNIVCAITTHFDNVLSSNMRHLRVKGLKDIEKIDKNKELQDYFDYSLEEITQKNSPKEAIKILKLLDIDNNIVEKIEEVLENGE